MNPLPSEKVAVLGTIDPDALTVATHVSDYCSMEKFESIMIVIQTGTLGTAATIDAVVKQATDSGGTGAKNLTTSKAITQLVKATNDDAPLSNVSTESAFQAALAASASAYREIGIC